MLLVGGKRTLPSSSPSKAAKLGEPAVSLSTPASPLADPNPAMAQRMDPSSEVAVLEEGGASTSRGGQAWMGNLGSHIWSWAAAGMATPVTPVASLTLPLTVQGLGAAAAGGQKAGEDSQGRSNLCNPSVHARGGW